MGPLSTILKKQGDKRLYLAKHGEQDANTELRSWSAEFAAYLELDGARLGRYHTAISISRVVGNPVSFTPLGLPSHLFCTLFPCNLQRQTPWIEPRTVVTSLKSV